MQKKLEIYRITQSYGEKIQERTQPKKEIKF